jgi:hypothetical protein
MYKRITPLLAKCSLAIAGAALLMAATPVSTNLQASLSVTPDRIQQAVPKNLRVPQAAQPAATQYRGYYLEALPVPGTGRPVVTTAPPAAKAAPAAATAKTSSPVSTNAVTPLCTVLAINMTYNLTGTATGGSYCYGFQVTARAKTTAFITGQNANTNFALTLIKHNHDDTLTVLGTSDQPGNANEILLSLTQPGLYYWLMDANASDGSQFSFGTIVNTNADANELNDIQALATAFPAVRTALAGNMDSASDVDYFKFVSQNGQSVLLYLVNPYSTTDWIFQYDTGSGWANLNLNQPYTLAVPTAPYTVNVRVLPNPAATLNPAHSYSLTVATQVMSSDLIDAYTNENIVRVNNPWMTDQAHQFLNWTIRLLDSNGSPVQGVQATFRWKWDNSSTIFTSTAISNSAGVASATANFGTCSGSVMVTETTAGQTWRTWFDSGVWDLKVAGASDNLVGVGGTNYPTVSLGHICSQTFIP